MTDGSYLWHVSGVTSVSNRVKIVLTANSLVFDLSDTNFTIIRPHIWLIHPNGWEHLTTGIPDTVLWLRYDYDGPVRVQMKQWFPMYPPSEWVSLGVSNGNDLVWIPTGPGFDRYANADR